MLGYNRTITRTNINVLINIGPGAGQEGKEEVKKVTFPTLLTMILGVKQRHENTTLYTRDANAVPEEQNANNNQEIYKNSESDLQEPLSIDKQDETVGIIKESILQRYEIAKETPNRSEATNSKKKKKSDTQNQSLKQQTKPY